MTRVAGVVSAFSADVGLGTVTGPDGQAWDFHCTALADGSRTVAVGTEVTFVVVAGRAGRWEAADLRA